VYNTRNYPQTTPFSPQIAEGLPTLRSDMMSIKFAFKDADDQPQLKWIRFRTRVCFYSACCACVYVCGPLCWLRVHSPFVESRHRL
jgi:hypothetical protein